MRSSSSTNSAVSACLLERGCEDEVEGDGEVALGGDDLEPVEQLLHRLAAAA